MDELAVIRYGLKRTDIPRYMLQAFGSGACRSLAKIRCRELAEGYEIAFDPSGLIRADGFVRDLRSLTALLRRTTEAALDAADFLVPDGAVSLRPETVFLRPQGGRAVLLPQAITQEGYLPRICALCISLWERVPSCSGDLLASRLAREDAAHVLSGRDLLRFLTQLELELGH